MATGKPIAEQTSHGSNRNPINESATKQIMSATSQLRTPCNSEVKISGLSIVGLSIICCVFFVLAQRLGVARAFEGAVER